MAATPMDLSHARSASTPAAPTLTSYADWERAHSSSRARSNTAGRPTARAPASLAEEDDDDDDGEAAAGDEAPPAYSRGKPPKYSRADAPALAHTHSMPVAQAGSVAQARFPTQLPARNYDPKSVMDMGGVRRYTDGRRPCRVGRDGKCECGRQVMSPETQEARDARRKEQFNMKGRTFFYTMGMSFARAFMI